MQNKRILAFLLVLVMLLMLLPTTVFATEGKRESSAEATRNEQKEETPGRLHPILDEQTTRDRGHTDRLREDEGDNLNKLVYRNRDGSKTMYLYQHPVKYRDEKGQTHDISLEIADTGNAAYPFRTWANSAVTEFPASLPDGITLRGNGVELRLSGQGHTGRRVDEHTVSYTYDSKTTIEYALTYTGFKEDIVVSEYTGQTEYPFTLYTNGLFLTNLDGGYYLTDETGTIQATIGDVIVFTADERNNTFGSLRVNTVAPGQQYELTIVLDADYLADPNTVYPIRIDPTVELVYTDETPNAIEEKTIQSNNTVNGAAASIFIGYGASGINRILMKFPGMDFSALEGATVTSAVVSIRDLMCETEAMTITCYPFTGSAWTESDSQWSNMTQSWGTALDSKVVSYYSGLDQESTHRYRFNITDLAQQWVDGTAEPAKGIIFRAESSVENGTDIFFKTFGTSERASYRPIFEITYQDEVSILPDEVDVDEGSSVTLTVNSVLGISSDVTWKSSNEGIAKVDENGVVTGVKAGKATITATCIDEDGNTLSAKCTVYVTLADGVYYFQNFYSQKYLSVEDAGIIGLVNVQQQLKVESGGSEWLCQLWKVKYLGVGLYTIRPMHKLDKALDVTNTNVDIYTIGTSDSLSVNTCAQWYIEWNLQGYVFRNYDSDDCALRAENASTAAGANIVVDAYSPALTSFKWVKQKLDNPPSGAYLYDTINDTAVNTATRDVEVGTAKSLSELNLVAVAYSEIDNNQSFTWYSSDNAIATVDSTGEVTGVSSGKATITGYVYRDSAYYYVSYTIYVGFSFETTGARFSELYDVAFEYNTNPHSATLLTMQFIRRTKYYGDSWNTVAGTVDSQFVDYVKTKYPSLYRHFTLETNEEYYFLDPNGEGYIDLPHLCATMNGLLYDSEGLKADVAGEETVDDLCGWAGDLQQLCIQVLDCTNNSDDYDIVYYATYDMIGDEAYSFSMMDLLADMDAGNIYQLYISSASGLINAFFTYYDDYVGTRYTQFTDGCSKETLYNSVRKYTTNTFALREDWPLLKGYDITDTQANAIALAVTDFIWEKVQNE